MPTLAEVLGLNPNKLQDISQTNKKNLGKWIQAIKNREKEVLQKKENQQPWDNINVELKSIEDRLDSWKPITSKNEKKLTSQLKTIAGKVVLLLGDGGQGKPPEILLKTAEEKENALKTRIDELVQRLDEYQRFVSGSQLYDPKTVSEQRKKELDEAQQARVTEIEELKKKVLAVSLEKIDDLAALEKSVKEIYKFKFNSELKDGLEQKVIPVDKLEGELKSLRELNEKRPYPWRQSEVTNLLKKLDEFKNTLGSQKASSEEKEVASNLARINLWSLQGMLTNIKVPVELLGKSASSLSTLESNIDALRNGGEAISTAFQQEKDFALIKATINKVMAGALSPVEVAVKATKNTKKLYDECKDLASESFLESSVKKLPTIIDSALTAINTNKVFTSWEANDFGAAKGSVAKVKLALEQLKQDVSV